MVAPGSVFEKNSNFKFLTRFEKCSREPPGGPGLPQFFYARSLSMDVYNARSKRTLDATDQILGSKNGRKSFFWAHP